MPLFKSHLASLLLINFGSEPQFAHYYHSSDRCLLTQMAPQRLTAGSVELYASCFENINL